MCVICTPQISTPNEGQTSWDDRFVEEERLEGNEKRDIRERTVAVAQLTTTCLFCLSVTNSPSCKEHRRVAFDKLCEFMGDRTCVRRESACNGTHMDNFLGCTKRSLRCPVSRKDRNEFLIFFYRSPFSFRRSRSLFHPIYLPACARERISGVFACAFDPRKT